MRDDLHRTVPLSRQWRPVLKYVSREADWERLPDAISVAVRTDIEVGLSKKWATSFKEGLLLAGDDLFNFDRITRVLNDFERNNPTPLQRSFCEVARGLYMREGNADQLFERTIGELCRIVAKKNIESVAAQVKEHHGKWVANQVRQRLWDYSQHCLFEPRKPRQRRTKHEGVLALLDTAIRIKIK